MSTDKGYGPRGGGGTANDLQDTIPGSATAGTELTDASTPRPLQTREAGTIATPSTAEATDEDTGASSSLRQYLLKEEQSDRLVCERLLNGTTFTGEGDPAEILITKPQNARRSLWEDETREGITYTYPEEDNHSLRIAARVGEDPLVNPPVYQRYVNPYIPGFSIIYAGESEDGTNSGAVNLIDMNNDGRQWAIERPLTVAEQNP